jgi:glycine dehydrogenase
MVEIRSEIQEVIEGKADKNDNVLKNAPHTALEAMRDDWTHPYPRIKAVFPLPGLKRRKFWPPSGRINNTFGDRNVVCTCPPIEDYR